MSEVDARKYAIKLMTLDGESEDDDYLQVLE